MSEKEAKIEITRNDNRGKSGKFKNQSYHFIYRRNLSQRIKK